MKRAICIFLICVAVCFSGCESKAERTLFAMDTVMDLQVWGADSQDALDALEALILETEKNWSVHRENSVIAACNRGEWTEETLIERCYQLFIRTGGAFDPRLYAVSKLWGFGEESHRVPTWEQVQNALQERGWDLGGAVKGYAGQLAAEKLQEMNVDRGILNLGGNVQTYGNKPNGEPWSIGIQNPNGGDPVGQVSVTGTVSVVTSGDYQRYFEIDGVRYHHIIDPETGYPADSGLRSVTVICRDGLTADALSTALFVMGLEKGSEFWRQSDDFAAVFITADGKIYATEDTALSGCEYEVITREN